MTTLRAAGITDPGQVRTQNQDAFYVADALILIADGMGGYAGGEVAAAIAAEVVGAHFAEDGSARGLEAAVADANRQIFERGTEPGLEGMGTTLVAAALVGDGAAARVLVANVGDSRAYLLHDGEAPPADRGPLRRRRARPAGPPRGGRGPRAPGAPRAHPGARRRPRRRAGPDRARPGRRRPPAPVQRRPEQRARRRRDPGPAPRRHARRTPPARSSPRRTRTAASTTSPPSSPTWTTPRAPTRATRASWRRRGRGRRGSRRRRSGSAGAAGAPLRGADRRPRDDHDHRSPARSRRPAGAAVDAARLGGAEHAVGRGATRPHRARAPAPASRGPPRAPRVQQVGQLPRRAVPARGRRRPGRRLRRAALVRDVQLRGHASTAATS